MTETSAAASPAERDVAAFRALYDHEDFIRRLHHFSDDELRARMRATVALEKKAIDEWLGSGDCFVVSNAMKVHLPACPTVWQLLDRDAAWKPYFHDLNRVRDWQGSAQAPAWPMLRTRAQVEDLPRYTACGLCAPGLTNKRKAAQGSVSLPAGSLQSKHFGTEFSLPDGTVLGALTRITTDETIRGLVFRAEFDKAEAPVTDPATKVMYRPGTRALA